MQSPIIASLVAQAFKDDAVEPTGEDELSKELDVFVSQQSQGSATSDGSAHVRPSFSS
jgi:hypothetical protein